MPWSLSLKKFTISWANAISWHRKTSCSWPGRLWPIPFSLYCSLYSRLFSVFYPVFGGGNEKWQSSLYTLERIDDSRRSCARRLLKLKLKLLRLCRLFLLLRRHLLVFSVSVSIFIFFSSHACLRIIWGRGRIEIGPSSSEWFDFKRCIDTLACIIIIIIIVMIAGRRKKPCRKIRDDMMANDTLSWWSWES